MNGVDSGAGCCGDLPDHFDHGPQPDEVFKNMTSMKDGRTIRNRKKDDSPETGKKTTQAHKAVEVRMIYLCTKDDPVFLSLSNVMARKMTWDGYPEINSMFDGLMSIFRIHNETMNIWTHIFGVFLTLTFLALTGLEIEKYPFMDSLMLAVFAVCGTLCFLGSVVFHTYKCYSYDVYRIVVTLDYLGIFVMIYGSFFSGLYFEFYCQYTERVIYQVGITLLVIAGVVFSFSPKFDDDRYMYYRLGIFFGLSTFAILPMVSATWNSGVGRVMKWLLLLALYGAGAFFYVTKFPESKFPGKFNIWLSSHQLWHSMVVLGVLWHYYSLKHLHIENHSQECQVVDDGVLSFLSSIVA
eukprot:CFRG1219T1